MLISIETSNTLPYRPKAPVNTLLKDAPPGLLKWAFCDYEDLGGVLLSLVEECDSVR
jgi:hypothetical protein